MTATAAETTAKTAAAKAPATPTAVHCAAADGRAVMADSHLGGKRHYYLDVPSPRDASKLTRIYFRFPLDPEFRVAEPGTDPLPVVQIVGYQDPAKAPKYLQKAVAEVLVPVAAWEARYQFIAPRTPAEHDEIGPHVTRAQHAEMIELHSLRLEHYDRETVVAILRTAVEHGWSTPETVSELESERDAAAEKLEEHQSGEEDRSRSAKAFDELIAETGRFFDLFNGIGVPAEGFTPAQREAVLDHGRHLEAALDEALNATC